MMTLAILSGGEGGFDLFSPTGVGNVLWTWVIFLLALPAIWKFVMGPVSRALEERDDHAVRAIAAAEKASSEAEAARAEVEVRVGEARTEAARLMDEARDRAEVREREIVEAAKAEAGAMVESARGQIQAERDKAVASIRAEVVGLSLQAAGAVLERNVGSEDDIKLVSELVSTTEESPA